MAVAKVDSQRRVYIPKEIAFSAEKTIIIPYGSSLLLVPVPEKIIEIEVKASIPELKERADEKAKQEARTKMKQRQQAR